VNSGRKTAILGFAALLSACGGSDTRQGSLQPEYNARTGKLVLLRYDTNGDGHVDILSYMDGARIVRIEVDKNEDGKIDRWEHYQPPGNTLVNVGFSRKNDGIEDAWTYAGPDGTVSRIEISTRRNGQVDRSEFYEKGVMVRVEEDSDGDGKPDKWERYENGRLLSVDVDTTHTGSPNRRMVYLPDGSSKLEHLGR
jgi:hypothetical protein